MKSPKVGYVKGGGPLGGARAEFVRRQRVSGAPLVRLLEDRRAYRRGDLACEAARLRLTRTYDDPARADRAASVINEARLRPGCHAPLVVAVWGPEEGQKTVMTVEEAEDAGFVGEDD